MRDIAIRRKTSKRFSSTLLEAVDEGLLILGNENVRRATYYHIEKRHGVKREDIPDKLENFHKALEDLFGVGVKIIERRIARNIYDKLGLSFREDENWTLADYIKEARISETVAAAENIST